MKICNRKATSNTGHVGITETHVKGRPCFSVSWRPSRYEGRHRTIYFTPEMRAAALQTAIEFRKVKVAARWALEGTPLP